MKNKKKIKLKKSKIILLASLFLVVLLIALFAFMKLFKHKNAQENFEDQKSDKMPYVVRFNATPLQTQLFKDLEKAYDEKDDKKIAGLIAQNFVADFYTLSNKTLKNDIGGVQFWKEDVRINFRNKAINSFYYNFETYIHDFGKTDLPEVSEFTKTDVTVEKDIYNVSLTWNYKPVKKFPISDFQKTAKISLKKLGNRFNILYTGEK